MGPCWRRADRGGGDGLSMHLEVRRAVGGRKQRDGKLPSELVPGATLLAILEREGITARIADRFRLSRRGGFGGLEVFAFAVLYLAAGPLPSIRAFYTRCRDYLPLIARLVGRRDLPSSGSLSRALTKLTMAQVDSLSDDLLGSVLGADEFLRRPEIVHHDAHGASWHVFDFDPSVLPFRQRDLEEGEHLPQPERRARGVPGYVGRKRGEIRQRAMPLYHSGAGLWCYMRLDAEGGSATKYVEGAAACCERVVQRIGHPVHRALIRTDGEFGHAAAVDACAKRGLHYLTRLTRPHLHDRPEVQELIREATWRSVASMGPVQREAADLGTVLLHDGDEEVAPVPARVVLTRFRTDRELPDRGVIRDGYQIEMFATSLPSDAWPAEDVAWLYAERAVIENALGAEDREYALDRTFSFNPAGQALMMAVGLFLWNHAVCTGARRLPPRPSRPAQQARPPGPELDSAPQPEESRPVPEDPIEHDCTHCEEAHDTLDAGATLDPAVELGRIMARNGARWPAEWRFDILTGTGACPAGKPLYPYSAEVARRGPDGTIGKNRLAVRTAIGACDGCALRPGCFSSAKQNTYKSLCMGISREEAARAVALLATCRAAKRSPKSKAPTPRPPRVPAVHSIGTPLVRRLPTLPPGPLMPAAPTFSPAAARAAVRCALDEVTLEVFARARPMRARSRRLTPPDRRHCRLSWTERLRRSAASSGGTAIATASRDVRALLFAKRPPTIGA